MNRITSGSASSATIDSRSPGSNRRSPMRSVVRNQSTAPSARAPHGSQAPRRATHGEIVGRLEIDPELRRRSERLGEEPSGLGRHAALPADDLVDPLEGDSEVAGEMDLADRQRAEEL